MGENYSAYFGLSYFSANGIRFMTAHSLPKNAQFCEWLFYPDAKGQDSLYENVVDMPSIAPNSFVHRFSDTSRIYNKLFVRNHTIAGIKRSVRVLPRVDIEIKDASCIAEMHNLRVKLKATSIQGVYLKCLLVSTDVYDEQVIHNLSKFGASAQHINYFTFASEEDVFNNFEATIYNADQFVRHEIQIVNIFGEIVYSQEVKPENLNVEVYPTQVQSVLNIRTALTAKAYSIVSQNGSPAASGVIAGNYQRLDVSNLSPGFYMICLYNDGTLLGTRKFIKTN
jgi:hypothetical protein